MRKRSKRSRRGRRSRRPFSKNRNIDAAFPAPASHFLLLLFMQYPRSRRLLSIEIGIRLSSHLVARHGHADPGVRERSHARGGAEAVNRCCWCCSCCCCCRCRGGGAARRAGRRERRREPACQRREARAGGHEEEKRKRKRKRRKEERETSESGVIFFRFFVPRCRLLKRHHFFFSFSLLHRFPCFPLCFSNEGGRLSPFSPWSRDANTRRGDDKRCAVHRERERERDGGGRRSRTSGSYDDDDDELDVFVVIVKVDGRRKKRPSPRRRLAAPSLPNTTSACVGPSSDGMCTVGLR